MAGAVGYKLARIKTDDASQWKGEWGSIDMKEKEKNSDWDLSCMHRFLMKHVSGSKLMQAPGFKWSMCQLRRKMFSPVMKGVAYYNKMCVGIQIKHVLG